MSGKLEREQRIDYWILHGRDVVRVDDVMTWALWMEQANRIVAVTDVGNSQISTVFIGLNHQWGDGPPLIFETLVFGGLLDGELERYSTLSEAEAGHIAMCERVRSVMV